MLAKLGSYRKDIQWISGLLFVGLLTASLFVGGVARFFAPEIAKSVVVSVYKDTLQTTFSKNYAQARTWFQSRPPAELVTIPGIPKTGVTAGEAAQLDAQGLATRITDKLADRIYNNSIGSFTAQERQSLGPLVYFNKTMHESLSDTAYVLTVLAFICGIIMIVFGRRFGRLFSFGLALFSAALLPAIVWSLVEKGFANPSATPQQAASTAALANAMKPALEAGQGMVGVYIVIGCLLMLMASFGRAVQWFTTYKQTSGGPADTTGSSGISSTHQARVVDLEIPLDRVFDLCLASLSEVRGKVKQQDRSLGTITAKTGIKWTSNGETIEFAISALDSKRSQVRVSSRFSIPALLDPLEVNRNNVEKISGFLRSREQEYKAAPETQKPAASTSV